MSIKGSPHSRFLRAIDTGNPTLVLAAAAELPRVDLADALAVCLVLLDGRSTRYDRAATRWLGRFCLETRGLRLADAGLIHAALDALRGEQADAAAQALLGVFEAREHAALAAVIARWSVRTRRDG